VNQPEVIYLCVKRVDDDELGFRVHTGPTVDETLHSIQTLRRFHPDIPVYIYTDTPSLWKLGIWKGLDPLYFMPIGVERGQPFMYPHENFWEHSKWQIPDLRILVAKLDTMLVHPGAFLFLDSDTEVVAPLDEIFQSDRPVMHAREYPLQNSAYDRALHMIDWSKYGITPPQVAAMDMINSGVVWVPWKYRQHLYRVKRWLIQEAYTEVGGDGSNRLKEQLGLSVFLQALGEVRTCEHLINHLWWRRSVSGKEWMLEDWRWYEQKVSIAKKPPAAGTIGAS
jgi:hypothetical protein